MVMMANTKQDLLFSKIEQLDLLFWALRGLLFLLFSMLLRWLPMTTQKMLEQIVFHCMSVSSI